MNNFFIKIIFELYYLLPAILSEYLLAYFFLCLNFFKEISIENMSGVSIIKLILLICFSILFSTDLIKFLITSFELSISKSFLSKFDMHFSSKVIIFLIIFVKYTQSYLRNPKSINALKFFHSLIKLTDLALLNQLYYL